MLTTNASFNEVVLTVGEDAENQMKSIYIKLWTFEEGLQDYSTLSIWALTLEPRNLFLVGKLGEPEKIISSIHLMNDMTLLTVGTKRGSLTIYKSKNLLEANP